MEKPGLDSSRAPPTFAGVWPTVLSDPAACPQGGDQREQGPGKPPARSFSLGGGGRAWAKARQAQVRDSPNAPTLGARPFPLGARRALWWREAALTSFVFAEPWSLIRAEIVGGVSKLREPRKTSQGWAGARSSGGINFSTSTSIAAGDTGASAARPAPGASPAGLAHIPKWLGATPF